MRRFLAFTLLAQLILATLPNTLASLCTWHNHSHEHSEQPYHLHHETYAKESCLADEIEEDENNENHQHIHCHFVFCFPTMVFTTPALPANNLLLPSEQPMNSIYITCYQFNFQSSIWNPPDVIA